MSTELTGILVACTTPFTADGSAVDHDNLQRQVDRLIDAGVGGLVPCGTTGEFTTLTEREYEDVITAFVRAAAGRVPVCPGVGSTSTARAVALARHCEANGAAAIMLLPPFYDSPNYEALKVFMRTVAESISIPIMYYNVPGATGVRLSADELAGLGDIPGVKYMKDTSGDAVTLMNLLVDKQDRISAFNGWDTLTFFGMATGAKASVWGMAGILPEHAVALWNAVAVRRDLDEGLRLWKPLWELCDFLESVNYVSAIKTAMDLIGHSVGPARPPVLPLHAEERATLRRLLEACGVKTV
jgi:dihydrodipicolinate synthase/N-acetylneuraminate lyase